MLTDCLAEGKGIGQATRVVVRESWPSGWKACASYWSLRPSAGLGG